MLVTKEQYKELRKGFSSLVDGKKLISKAKWIEITKQTGITDEEVAKATFDAFDVDENGFVYRLPSFLTQKRGFARLKTRLSMQRPCPSLPCVFLLSTSLTLLIDPPLSFFFLSSLDEQEFLDMSALMLAGTPDEQLRGLCFYFFMFRFPAFFQCFLVYLTICFD
jgi:hypothetical protein